jgi:hypothetical protein
MPYQPRISGSEGKKGRRVEVEKMRRKYKLQTNHKLQCTKLQAKSIHRDEPGSKGIIGLPGTRPDILS